MLFGQRFPDVDVGAEMLYELLAGVPNNCNVHLERLCCTKMA
jgi:hypothetical protein